MANKSNNNEQYNIFRQLKWIFEEEPQEFQEKKLKI